MKTRVLVALGAALVLTACGGGGGDGPGAPGAGGTPANPEVSVAERRAAFGGDPLDLSSAQVSASLQARAAAADRLLLSDFSGVDLSGPYRRETRCSGGVCVSGETRVTIADLDLTQDYEALMVRDGVSVAAGSAERALPDGGRRFDVGFGGWLEHSVFAANLITQEGAGGATAVFFGTSVGTESGSAPLSGSAIWRGFMTGLDASDVANARRLQGDALLTANFAASSLDVRFTNVRDEDLGHRADIRFDDVPLTASGFARRGADRQVSGTFYGPDHVEAGGVFEAGGVVGAFGARRQ